VVNPSLRAWSETFCIANIEVMASGVPLVTFGVGGVGDYVLSPHPTAPMQDEEEGDGRMPNIEVAANAILLNKASPHAIADAIELLYTNDSLRMELGAKGRESVKSYFIVERQMIQYSKLYRDLKIKKDS